MRGGAGQGGESSMPMGGGGRGRMGKPRTTLAGVDEMVEWVEPQLCMGREPLTDTNRGMVSPPSRGVLRLVWETVGGGCFTIGMFFLQSGILTWLDLGSSCSLLPASSNRREASATRTASPSHWRSCRPRRQKRPKLDGLVGKAF